VCSRCFHIPFSFPQRHCAPCVALLLILFFSNPFVRCIFYSVSLSPYPRRFCGSSEASPVLHFSPSEKSGYPIFATPLKVVLPLSNTPSGFLLLRPLRLCPHNGILKMAGSVEDPALVSSGRLLSLLSFDHPLHSHLCIILSWPLLVQRLIFFFSGYTFGHWRRPLGLSFFSCFSFVPLFALA